MFLYSFFYWLYALLFCYVWLCALTLLLETLGCVWLLLETLVTFGCVPHTFAEMLLLHASITSNVMLGCALDFLSDVFG